MQRQSRQPKFDLVVFGEFFSDMIFYQLPRRPLFGEEQKTDSFLVAPGGGLSTTAIAASRLGTATGIITRVGADARSLPTWNDIVHEKLDITACEFRKDLPTALQRKLEQTRHVHLACALHRPTKWLPVLRRLRERGITVSADFGWNPDISVTQLISIVQHCEFIFPNEREARAVTGTTSARRALEKLQDWVRVPVVKMGTKGALLLADGKVHEQPGLHLPMVDATGTGDAFDGGFLHAFLHGADWDECLRAGNICGSLAGTRPGGSRGLPDIREFNRYMRALRKA
jgi:sugar/nucleoside kinase (ribokinase family)